MASSIYLKVVPQAIFGVQLNCGDVDEAEREDFLQECPLVSKAISTVQLSTGNVDGTLETQEECGKAGGRLPSGAGDLAKATALETHADAMLEAVEFGKNFMPSGEYSRMTNEADAFGQRAQHLKGAPSPIDLKGLIPSPNSVPVDVRPQEEVQQEDQTIVKAWVIWLTDDVFVIGTDETTVELITAFLVNDISRLEQICEQLGFGSSTIFGENCTKLTHEEIVQIFLDTKSVRQLTPDQLIELIKKGGKLGRKAVQRFFKSLFQQEEQTPDNGKRSIRGEHVINNGVINVYKDIMEQFLIRSGLYNRNGIAGLSKLYTKLYSIRNCSKYFDTKIKNDIQYVMKVFFEQNTRYIDANAFLYGRAIQALRETAVEHMMELYSNENRETFAGSRKTRPMKDIVKIINEKLLYVDQHALSIWLMKNGTKTYKRAQITVHHMFNELYEKPSQWIGELEGAVF